MSESGESLIINEEDPLQSGSFPPVEERSGPEGAEEEAELMVPAPEALRNEDEYSEDRLGGVSMTLTSSQILPWGAPKERSRFPSSVNIETDLKPGEFVMRTLFAEFTVQAERKISAVMAEPLERPLSKSLQRGEDPQFDQLLSAFGSVAEHCLPSLLRTLFAWYERQSVEWIVSDVKGKGDSKGKSDLTGVRSDEEFASEKRDLAIEFIFCLVLIEVLKMLSVHPGHEDLVQYIENLAFKHFRYRDGQYLGPNASNIHIIADLYAEVLGVLAQSRFLSTKTKFFSELRELRAREPSTHTTQSIITLLMGMKFFRVKMVPFEDFELSFQFMLECAQYFLEVKDKDIKHAVAGLFVEILVPVAAAVKNEVNVPCLKKFVETLYAPTLDMCTRSKRRLAIFPLVTCLLCVSQKTFFLHNWHCFLAMCLQQLKNKDTKMARVALESLYRLLWVYMIRIKCESNNVTQSRLQSIVNSLFPKGSKAVVPRDTPLNIFVRIIQFIAQEKMEFAMKEIVFDLLSVGRPIKVINAPERLSIGLRAFLVVADSLQQKEGDPPMPRTVGVMPSGSTSRVKKTFLNKMLTEDAAKGIGISSYYSYVRKVFDDILRALDAHFGKPFLLTNTQATGNKEAEDAKPKLDLFRTVIAAIPRLIPDGMSRSDLVDTLSRLTVHNDEELRRLAWQSLQNLIVDFPEWREDVLYGFMQFVAKEVLDSQTQLLDNALRMILQLLTAWKTAAEKVVTVNKGNFVSASTRHDRPDLTTTLHMVEGFAFVMLCHCRLAPRKLSYLLLKEVKALFKITHALHEELTLLDALDHCTSLVLDDEKVRALIPLQDRALYSSLSSVDFQWLTERTSAQWTGGFGDDGVAAKSGSTQHLFSADPWSACLMGFLDPDRLPTLCSTAVFHSWPIVHTRLTQHFNVVDPAPVTDNRASLLRPGTAPKKTMNEKDISMHLWKNYISFACRVVPTIPSPVLRCASPDIMFSSIGSSSSPESLGLIDRSSDNKSPSMVSPSVMYKLLVPLIRCEVPDMRDCVVQALGRINHNALSDLMSELWSYIKEAIDRKQENMRRKRRRDALRLQLVRVLELIASHGTFSRATSGVTDSNSGSLAQTFTDYIDGARQILESENDKFAHNIREIKLSFSLFIRKLIFSFSLERRKNLIKRDLRKSLFYLFAGWSGCWGQPFEANKSFVASSTGGTEEKNQNPKEFEFSSLQSMISVLSCGPCFDESLFTEDGSVYAFLNLLLQSEDQKIYKLAQEAIVLLLEFNPKIPTLLEWVVEKCFTGEPQVADSCFLALATIFATREYPCDHYTAIINVTLMNTGCPRTMIYETALQLLQILDHRFFGTVYSFQTTEDESSETKEQRSTLDALLATTYSRSQLYLSRQLSQLHTELTMPMFSEICHRLQTARPPVIKNLLFYLLPWLYNMELVDCNLNPSDIECNEGTSRESWGSTEATEMITNNLFYITVKFGDDHPMEIEELWSALCACWPRNLRIIIRYLVIICGIATPELVEYAKRVLLYLGRSQPVKTLEEIMVELQTVENLNCAIERTEAPPYYRMNSLRKTSSNCESNAHLTSSKQDLSVEKGTIHTKRHSQEDPVARENPKSSELSISGSLKSAGSIASNAGSVVVAGIQRVGEKVRALSGSAHSNLISSSPPQQAPVSATERVFTNPIVSTSANNSISENTEPPSYSVIEKHSNDSNSSSSVRKNPHRPLPMPEYGGWFAPLTEFLPDASQPISNFHRCNIAVILLTDMLVDGLDCHQVDWSTHVPLMLHIVFLGLDNSRQIVQSHCQQLLLNLLIVLGDHGDHLAVSTILMNNKTEHLNYGLTLTSLPIPKLGFNGNELIFEEIINPSKASSSPEKKESDDIKLSGKSESIEEDVAVSNPPSVRELTKSIINFIASRQKCQPFWQYEDITRTVWSIPSAEQIDHFLQRVLLVFEHSLPHALLSERWSQLSLQLALSCSSRHYAGRSLQIFRALRVPISSRMLSDILSRLVETIAEQGDDMQGYVTELILTLESVIDALDSDFRPMDLIKDIFKSTPNLKEATLSRPGSVMSRQTNANIEEKIALTPTKEMAHSYHVSAPPCGKHYYHSRSTSFNVSLQGKTSPNQDIRCRSSTDSESCKNGNSGKTLSRSRSAQSLRVQDQASQDDKMTTLVQLFWICLAVLESDYEHEFLLGIRLLEKVMGKLPLNRPDAREKIEKLQGQLKWINFPGVHSLLLKGCTNPNTYESTIQILTKFTMLLDFPVIDPSQSLAFSMNVIALLPYMVQNYEDANETCIFAAENIAHVSNEKNKKLENLATVMTLYSRRTFSKESFQWTKCVVKYLYDTYSHFSFNMLGFLVEVLEKGPSSIQAPILTIIHCLLHYVDMSSATQTINADLLRTVAKFVESQHWKESLKILKLAVTRSSTLVAPPSSSSMSSSYHWETVSSVGSFAEADLYFKKELPGRTMEFTFDLSQTPVIGRRHPQSQPATQSLQNYGTTNSATSSSSSYFASFTGSVASATSSAPGTTASSGVVIGDLKEGSLKSCASNFNRSMILGHDSILNLNDIGSNNGVSSTMSPRRSLSLSAVDSSSFSGWKRPWLCQSRVRERLVNILNSCGQRVGLPKSPSVIFSQTSELLEHQSSMASSTEEVSANNDDKQHDTTDTEQKFGMYMREFDFLEYEFESLEGESVDNFNWGVRRPSLSHLDGDEMALDSMNEVTPTLPHRDSNVGVGAEESSDDELGSVSPGIDEEILSTRSSEDQSGASSSISTTSSRLYPPSSLAMDNRRGRRPLTPNSDTESEEEGEEEEEDISDQDLTPCNASPSIFLNWGSVDNGDGRRATERQEDGSTEDAWKILVQDILGKSSNESFLQTFAVFACLFNELKTKTCVLSQDSSSQLSKENSNFSKDSMKLVVIHFQTLTDILSDVTKYPHVWCDLNAIGGSRLTERFKFNVLEIQENLDNFIDKKDLTIECLDAVKAHQKLLLLGEQLSEYNVDSEQLDLIRCLYKLHFQLLILLESFVKLIKLILYSYQTHSSDIPDKSSVLSSMQSELLYAAATTEKEPTLSLDSKEEEDKTSSNLENTIIADEIRTPSPLLEGLADMMSSSETGKSEDNSVNLDSSNVTESSGIVIAVTEPEYNANEKEEEDLIPRDTSSPKPLITINKSNRISEVTTELLDLLNNAKWNSAMLLFRQYRSDLLRSEEADIKGNFHSDEEDVHALLNIYCTHLVENSKDQSIFVMTVKETDLTKTCNHWMDASVQLLSTVKTMEKELTLIKRMSCNLTKHNF